MSESKFSQLRFDISEKVRLHPQQPGIETLLELDLYPDVEIRDEGNQLKIQGYLRLNGAYLGDSGANNAEVATTAQAENREELAYVIPVEITIPASRAELDNVSAEVENFDYSVVSPFELQVEAILSIDGLLPEEQEEKVKSKKSKKTSKATKKKAAAATHEVASETSFQAQPVVAENTNSSEEAKQEVGQESEFKEFLGTPDAEGKMDARESTANNSRPELHFSPNRNEDDSDETREEPTSVEYLNSLWNKKKVSEEQGTEEQFSQGQFAMEKEMEHSDEAPVAHSSQREKKEAEWVNWLMGSKEESFTSMRMVISQKDDSIDEIADRYGLPPGQLMHINQLEDNRLDEGQIIYIPRKLQVTS